MEETSTEKTLRLIGEAIAAGKPLTAGTYLLAYGAGRYSQGVVDGTEAARKQLADAPYVDSVEGWRPAGYIVDEA